MAESLNVSGQSGPRTPPEEIQKLEASKRACFEAFASWTHDISVITSEYQSLKNEHDAKDEYIKSIKAENQSYRGQIASLMKCNQELEKKLKSLDSDLRQSTVSSTNIHVQSLKKKNIELEEKLDVERNASKAMSKKYEYVVVKYKEKAREFKSLQENAGTVFDENDQLKGDMQRYEEQFQQLILQHNRDLQSLKAELQETKTRLSQLMSAQVMNNNPDIADLNDPHRPNKLSEMYRNLYDNQWSEAFDALHGDEHKNVQMLRKILKDARQFCEDEAEALRKDLTSCLFKGKCPSSLPNTLVKDMKDLTKAVLPYNIDIVGQKYLDKTWGDRQFQEMEPYCRECAKVCWIMVLNDPPIIFGPELKIGDIIDKGTYSLYTSSGNVCSYEVWPALFMSKGGALVSKGVVQAIEAAKPTSKKLTEPRPEPALERNVVIRGLDGNVWQQTTRREKDDFLMSQEKTSANSFRTIDRIHHVGGYEVSSTDYRQTNVRLSEQEKPYRERSYRGDLSESGQPYSADSYFHYDQ